MKLSKLQQHKLAIKEGGFSPFFGWILDGNCVSAALYQETLDKEVNHLERGGKLWN